MENRPIIEVESEHANKKCLDLLMNGVDFIYIDSKKQLIGKMFLLIFSLNTSTLKLTPNLFDDSLLLIHSLKDRIYKEQISFNHDICDIKYIPDNILKVLKVKQLKMFYKWIWHSKLWSKHLEEIAYSLHVHTKYY